MPRDVRILVDYRPALRQGTGVGRYVHEMASALAPLLPPESRLRLFSSSWKDRIDSRSAPAPAVDVRVPVGLLNLVWHRLEWPPVEWVAGPTDIAHSSHPLLMPTRGGAQVVTVYDLDFLDHPERTRAEIRRDYPRLAGPHARRADLVVVISEYTAAAVRDRLSVDPSRILVCRPGAPAWAARQPPAVRGPILFVGTIEPRKNLPTLFTAYEQVVSADPQAPRLLLAGGTVEHSAAILEPIARRPLLRDRVRHLGYVSDTDRERLYREASILVLPSFDEGFGMPVVEAMQVGLPVVASARGALPEVVGDAGILVDPASAEDLARAIGHLLADPGARQAYSQAGRRRAGRFSWKASAALLLDGYREILARRRRDR